jgi:hypothetical protein
MAEEQERGSAAVERATEKERKRENAAVEKTDIQQNALKRKNERESDKRYLQRE